MLCLSNFVRWSNGFVEYMLLNRVALYLVSTAFLIRPNIRFGTSSSFYNMHLIHRVGWLKVYDCINRH